MENAQVQPNPTVVNEKFYKKASFWERLLAFIIDGIIVGIPLSLLSTLFPVLNSHKSIIQFAAFALYGAFFITYKGATLGKIVVKIKVVTLSYEHVSFGVALLRESVGKYISEIVFFLGYFWVLIDKKEQAWHDKIAKTLVVKLDDTGKLIPVEYEEPVTTKRKILFAIVYLTFGLPVVFVSIFLIMYIFFYRPFQIAGNTMNPNYVNGQYYLTSIHFGTPSRGDVLILKEPDNPSKSLIKRVVGLPGDTILLSNGNVYLNGQVLEESKYISNNIKTYGGNFLSENQTVTVPQDSYFVMGDNRPYSSDSRVWGFVPKKDIISKVVLCYWKCSLSNSQ